MIIQEWAAAVLDKEYGVFSAKTRQEAIGLAVEGALEDVYVGLNEPGIIEVEIFEDPTWCEKAPQFCTEHDHEEHSRWLKNQCGVTIDVEVYIVNPDDIDSNLDWREVNKMGDEAKVLERTGGRIPKPSEWFKKAFAAAMVAGHADAWLLQYLEWTDGLAMLRGWPTGPGAPVHTWAEGHGQRDAWELTYPNHGYHRYCPSDRWRDGKQTVATSHIGMSDPMEALGAIWREVSS